MGINKLDPGDDILERLTRFPKGLPALLENLPIDIGHYKIAFSRITDVYCPNATTDRSAVVFRYLELNK